MYLMRWKTPPAAFPVLSPQQTNTLNANVANTSIHANDAMLNESDVAKSNECMHATNDNKTKTNGDHVRTALTVVATEQRQVSFIKFTRLKSGIASAYVACILKMPAS